MSQYPSLPLFTDAFIADTGHLSAQETGAYLMLLMVAWRTADCCLPDNDDKLARWARVDRRTWLKIKPTIMEFWTLEDGTWSQKRLSKERDFVSKRADVNRRNGEQGGRPKSLKNKKSDNPAGSSRVSETKAPSPSPTPIAASAAAHAPTHEEPPAPPDPTSSIELRKRVAAAFQELAPNRLVPDTNRAAVWLAQGYPPDLIVSVIREGLGRKPDVGSLAYFDRRLEDAKRAASPVSQGPEPTKTAPSPDQDRRHRLRLAITHFRGEWRQGTDEQYRPESPGCTTPSDIVDEARATVAAERRASGREAA